MKLDEVERYRPLEIMSATALLKAVSDRYAPGTAERILQFIADKGAVSVILNEYYANSDDIEKTCLYYWNSLIEPDSIRLEDLVSAILISFATSFAASVLIAGGKSAFPALYNRFLQSEDVSVVIKKLAALERRRRLHAETLLTLLNKKAAYIKESEVELQNQLASARAQLANGVSLHEFSEALPHSGEKRDLTSIESVVRGVLITEEKRVSGFDIETHVEGGIKLSGLPLSKWLGVGQILQSRVGRVIRTYDSKTYHNPEEFRNDVLGRLQNAHKNAYLKVVQK